MTDDNRPAPGEALHGNRQRGWIAPLRVQSRRCTAESR